LTIEIYISYIYNSYNPNWIRIFGP